MDVDRVSMGARGRLLPLPGLVSLALFLLQLMPSARASESVEAGGVVVHEEGHEGEPAFAVFFPWFAQALGVVVFYLMTRYVHALPYTAIMFILGTLMGIGSTLSGDASQADQSIEMWVKIDGEVMLLVFLPGLLFWDALNVNWYLFIVSIGQLLIMAFPMVLAGATLTACVGAYIFPYGWSFMFAMTFGSILAATDPVAVAALLNEVGAPPRLKMHVSGESMLNDGSAVVFYNVFGRNAIAKLNIGEWDAYTVGQGFALFFRMSLGGAAVGLAFGIALILIWYNLHNHLNHEENIVQVVASITIAYLSYYTSEMVCDMSGIVAVLMCGISARAFGAGMINNAHMMTNFWHLVEHLLNTLLFTLGGVEWGHIISDRNTFSGTDWGYLFVLYVLLHVIRFFLFFLHYPILSRIGLKTNWQETFFTSYGGLRGAVGIALALALYSEVLAHTEGNSDPNAVQARVYVSKLFGMVGGVAFLTLVINGTTAGFVLNKLGLTKATDTRIRILDRFESLIKTKAVQSMVALLTESRFAMVDFAVIRHHIPYLKDLTAVELMEAVHNHKEFVSSVLYKPPNLTNILPYLEDKSSLMSARNLDTNSDFEEQFSAIPEGKEEAAELTEGEDGNITSLVVELRYAFLDLLRAAYLMQIEKGELNPRENGGFLMHVLETSIEFASDGVSKGKPLQDWETAHIESQEFTDRFMVRTRMFVSRTTNKMRRFYYRYLSSQNLGSSMSSFGDRAANKDYREMRREVYKALAFIHAHRMAEERLEADFAEEAQFSAPIKVVMGESEAQLKLAEDLLMSKDEDDVKMLISHLFCKILLHQIAGHVENLTAVGLLKEKEANHHEERIEEAIQGIEFCSELTHPGELTKKELEDSTQNQMSDLSSILKNIKHESIAARQSTIAVRQTFKQSLMKTNLSTLAEDDQEAPGWKKTNLSTLAEDDEEALANEPSV